MKPNENLASVAKRFIAVAIDFLIVIGLNYLFFAIIFNSEGGLLGAMGLKDFQFGEDLVKGAFAGVVAILVLVITLLKASLITFLYDFLMTAFSKHATLGKRLMKIKVINENGDEIGIFAAFMRSLLKLASILLLFLPWFVALFTKQKQAWHDSLTHSIVIKEEEI